MTQPLLNSFEQFFNRSRLIAGGFKICLKFKINLLRHKTPRENIFTSKLVVPVMLLVSKRAVVTVVTVVAVMLLVLKRTVIETNFLLLEHSWRYSSFLVSTKIFLFLI